MKSFKLSCDEYSLAIGSSAQRKTRCSDANVRLFFKFYDDNLIITKASPLRYNNDIFEHFDDRYCEMKNSSINYVSACLPIFAYFYFS